ncbi:unnamed protein product [Prorocentrum cordatum]|uniref:Uncharacterized protein n=1 Tax=Prorocentrum cordatum TaxID=2364126 RepID=A0ABN9UH62_9DINO|nr:unnamed protein product [Polarella glacialis]
MVKKEEFMLMCHFLIGFAGCKTTYTSKILQVFNKLMQVPTWVAVWEAQSGPLGDKLKGLHANLLAALVVQSAVITKSISPMVMASMNQVSAMDWPEEIGMAMKRDRLTDEIQKAKAHARRGERRRRDSCPRRPEAGSTAAAAWPPTSGPRCGGVVVVVVIAVANVNVRVDVCEVSVFVAVSVNANCVTV